MTASLSVYRSYHWLAIVQSSLNTSCHIEQLWGTVSSTFNIYPSEKHCPSSKYGKLCFTRMPSPSALLLTCNCFADLFVVHSPHTQAHSDYFTTQLEIDVLRSSSMGWKRPKSGLLIPVLHCFQVSNGVFVEFMINDIFFDLAVHFIAHHQSHLSLRPYSSTAFTNVQLLEKFKETFQLLAIVVKTMKMPQ